MLTHCFEVDGKKKRKAQNERYDGLGFISANNSSRLLLDYKTDDKDSYQKILNYCFGKEGLNFQLIKVEMGADIDSSSGAEPAVKRSREEKANTRRGMGYRLIADALKINSHIKADMLYWGIPGWVNNAENKYEAMYQWYKETLDSAYDTYGIKFSYITACQNECDIDPEWVKYFAKRIKQEEVVRYDYSQIEIVVGEGISCWTIADMMMEDEELRDAVDIVSAHYTSFVSENARILKEKYGKKLWFSEGSSPMNSERLTCKYDGKCAGIGEMNGTLDIATRITQAIAEGMTMYEFQPAVSAYYDGVTYYPKQLITANEPWSGGYSLDAGYYMTLHFSRFLETGDYFIEDACYGDGKCGGDGHAMVDSKFNYVTSLSSDSKELTIIIVNQSEEEIDYQVGLRNLKLSSDVFHIWESTSHDSMFQRKESIRIQKPLDDMNDRATLCIHVKPYSMFTVSSKNIEDAAYMQKEIRTAGTMLALPYEDNFAYAACASGFLDERGGAPKYMTDQTGAFEVEKTLSGNALVQQITYDCKPVEWAGRNEPTTNFGDDRWADILLSAEVEFASATSNRKTAIPQPDHDNYVGVGVRYNLADAYESGYQFRIYDSGSWELKKDKTVVTSGKYPVKGEHTIAVGAIKNHICGYIDGRKVAGYDDEGAVILSGRAALYSDFEKNIFKKISVRACESGYVHEKDCVHSKVSEYVKRVDDLDSSIRYSQGNNRDDGQGWYHNTLCSFKNYNRTISVGHVGDSFSFEFEGSGFGLIGMSKDARVSITADGKVTEQGVHASSERHAMGYIDGLKEGKHFCEVKIIRGEIFLDAIEFWK